MEQQNTHNTTIDGVSYTTHPVGNGETCESCAAIEAEEGLCLQLWRASNCASGKHVWRIADAEIKASTDSAKVKERMEDALNDWRPIEKQDACTVYTVHLHHLPSGANLTVECPTLDVAQCVWDALSKSSTLTLSTSRPAL